MASPTEEHFKSLQLLLKAPSKDVVRQICIDSFTSHPSKSQTLVDSTAQVLTVTSSEAAQVLTAFHTLSHHVLFHNHAAPEHILSIFPETFHPNLKNLITKILLEQSVSWRNKALDSQISLPQLVDMEWRVDMKTASDSVSRMAVPTCILNIKMQDNATIGSSTGESSISVELNKETLDTIVDGLGRIRDQLSAVAGK